MKINTIPLPLEWKPFTHKGHKLDIFKYHVHATDGLPPTARSEAILAVAKKLNKLRPDAGLWVSVDSPGQWYINELKRLRPSSPPIAILPAGKKLSLSYFSDKPKPFMGNPRPPSFQQTIFNQDDYDRRGLTELNIIRALARLSAATTREIASQAWISRAYAGQFLKTLEGQGLVERITTGKYLSWGITHSGVRLAHRSWNIPPNFSFKAFRNEQRYAGTRHRRVSRLWPAWLWEAWGVKFWAGWSEPSLRHGYPDSLIWGQWGNQEVLLWLEVEAGKKSSEELKDLYQRRWMSAAEYARQQNVLLVYVIMAKPWVLFAIDIIFENLPDHMAVIICDWRDFGELSFPNFGKCISPLY